MSRPPIRRLTAALVAASLLLGAAACSDDDGDDAGATTTTAAEASFPVTVTAENGDVEVAAAPQRIVSLSPSLTEMLFALEAGAQVVAVDKSSNYPAGTPLTDMSGFRPNVEAIGGQEPDLVVLASDRDGIVDSLASLGIPTLLLSSADSLDDVYEQIEVLGDATGHPAEAGALVTDLQDRIATIVEDLPERDEPLQYFYELSDDLSTITSTGTFIGELFGLAGLESIADGADAAAGQFPKLSTEYVLDADPDYIFLAHTDGATVDLATVAARPGWAELQAVTEGHVVVLPADFSSRWGPRVVELLEAVAAVLTAESEG